MGVDKGATVRYHVVYSGRVQGVFFRATTRDLAMDQAVVGWVRNLADGSVELEVEGAEDAVSAFLSAVRARFEGHITSEDADSRSVLGAENEFVIRH